MEVVFLGFAEFNFDSKDGNHIEGVKFYYYFTSDRPNYHGFETGEIFINSNNKSQCDLIRSCRPGCRYRLQMGYNGRRAIFIGLDPVTTK